VSGVTLTATALAAMVVGCAAVGAVGQVARAHARVDTVADLTALAVASRATRGEPTDRACAAGTAVATASLPGQAASRVDGCAVDGGVATVTVSTEVTVLGVSTRVSGRARAGPALPGTTLP
jgi:hypothetical protein